MEDPQVVNDSLPLEPCEFSVKQEKPDSDRRGDKVLQFALALQRSSDKGSVTLQEQRRRAKEPIRIEYVDLTLSSDDEEEEKEDRSSTSTLPIDLTTNNINDIEKEMERVHEIEPIQHEQQPPPTTDVGEDQLDYENVTSALEVTMEEINRDFEKNHIHASFKRRKFSKSVWYRGQGLTIPYTDEQKRIALNGNPEFDYRTKLGENGEETYAIYKCHKCPTGFPRMHHYLIHMKGHGDNPNLKYSCEECDYGTTNSIFLAHHADRHRLQKEPHIFANLQRGNRGNAQKRRSESETKDNTNKKCKEFLGALGLELNEKKKGPPPGSPTESTALDLKTPETYSATEEACRIEARKGNPNFSYRISKRCHPNGQIYERSTYKCQQCPYSHEKYESYLKHLEGHIQQRIYQCHLCTYSASTQINLGRHLTSVHSHPQAAQESPRNEKGRRIGNRRHTFPVAVEKLTKGSTVSENICAQPRSALVGFTLKCSKCPTKFNGMGNLRIHENQHGKFDLRLRCPHCDYCSSRDDYMRNHIKVHSEQNGDENSEVFTPDAEVIETEPSPANSSNPSDTKPSSPPCPSTLPEEMFTKMRKGNPRFVYMEKTLNGHPIPLESSFKCWHCPYATIKYPSYVRHQKCHEANAQFACNKCSYSAKTLQGMKNHNLAHTIQHANKNEKSEYVSDTPAITTDQKEEFGPITPMIYSTEERIQRNEGQFFISNIKIQNVMPMNQEPTVADVSTHGILKLKGNSEEGKSSYILAVMLGMGYDLCLDHKDETTSICGLNLKNVISHGKEFASVELTISLRAFPELEKEYGSHLKFSRRITTSQPELSNVLVVSSADIRPQFKSVRPKVLGGKDLKVFMEKLKLSPERMRLMLLDGENVKYMMDNSDSWFGFLEAAVDESAVEIEEKIKENKFLLQRLHGEQKLQQERLEVFKARLHERPPLDSDKIRQLQQEDWHNHSRCTSEINELAKEKRELQKKLGDFIVQTNDGIEGYVDRMRSVFNKFLCELQYAGDIKVLTHTKELGICIWKIGSTELPPTTMDEVKDVWKTMSTGRRRIAVIGLYLALWEISNYLGILAADAYSCTETDFQVPPSGLPVLWDLLNRKCLEQKQCIISLPQDY